MTEEEALLEQQTWEMIEELERQQDEREARKAELFALLYENKFHKAHKISFKEYLVSRDKKPSSIDLLLRVYRRFGDIIREHGGRLSKARLQTSLKIKFSDDPDGSKERDFILTYCDKGREYDAFQAKVNELIGKEEANQCDHTGQPHEYWCKCKGCGTWIEDKH